MNGLKMNQDMVVAILAGGQGSRLRLQPNEPPKPMLEIGGYPILVHILNCYARFGFRNFVIALGYKGDRIQSYFDSHDGRLPQLNSSSVSGTEAGYIADATLKLIDTGQNVDNGGRIKRLSGHLGSGAFLLTWCDGLNDIDLSAFIAHHRSHGRLATVAAVHPPSQFGHMVLDNDRDQVTAFMEKPVLNDIWINGGLFMLEPQVLDYISGDETHWETGPMHRLAEEGELMAYRHEGFWLNMDTWQDRLRLDAIWASGCAPWYV